MDNITAIELTKAKYIYGFLFIVPTVNIPLLNKLKLKNLSTNIGDIAVKVSLDRLKLNKEQLP
ncbi:hypothetical protein AN640_04655 [Candidatus Epulonipiscium fishelsonii]|uniref:Uncharacterized protein n=1 Tax=Candidatus Epulonipiscium fishelsonii TaxID=77094 RepID=A0ACC8XIT9_9FIRM|nr:hypothetical protein AN640_04655 [Epulopiscium sp. SCG-D08WGA-EpuloA1]